MARNQMANISDQLAADIHNAFSKCFTDLANQDQIFFGVGDVTITRQDGTKATIRSWGKVTGAVDTAAQRGTTNTFTQINTFSAGINMSGDNAMIVLGKNNDLALMKKTGQSGTIAVGLSTAFRLQRSNKATLSPADSFTDLLSIGTDGRATFYGPMTVNGNIDMANYKITLTGLELTSATPYVDFHFGNSTADYTARIIATAVDQLTVTGSHLRIERDFRSQGTAMSVGDMLTDKGGYKGDVGIIQSGSALRCRMNGRGAHSDASGSWAGFYMEEEVGTEHRMVFMMDGFGKNVTMIFRPDRSLEMDTIRLNNGRTKCWTGIEANYLEIYVDGSARGVNFFNSDIRLKEDISDAVPGAAANVIKQLRPVSYKFKNTEYSVGKTYSFGILAQEAEKVIPDLIQTMSDDTKSIDPLAAIGLLLAHNKELEARVSALEEKIHN